MAPKRAKSLLENPPDASSSEDGDVEEEEEEEEEEVEEEEEEEEEEDDEEEDEATKPNSSSTVIKKPKSDPNPSSGSKPQTPSSEDEDEDEEEEDDDDDESEESDDEPAPPTKLKPSGPSSSSNPSGGKPIVSQPKKSVAKPSTKPSTTVKRPLETQNDSKRQKKKKKVDDEEDGSSNPEESEMRSTFGPTSIFKRLWSDEDEIVVLRGMIEFKKKEGVDPSSDLHEFHNSIKKSLNVVVKIDQLNNKIKRLKKKYLNNYKRGKGDEDPVFSKPHDVLSYELMKEIWGGKEGNIRENNAKDAATVVTNGKKTSTKAKKSNNAPTKTLSLSDISMRELSKLGEMNVPLHPWVQQEMLHSRNNMVGGSFLKEGLGLLGDSKRKDLENKWKSLQADELQLYMRRVELAREQTIAILDAYQSSDT